MSLFKNFVHIDLYMLGSRLASTSAAQKKIALVDFDGVIFKNHKVHNLVKSRIDNYVGRRLKTECREVSSRMNKYLYDTYGHTLLGLEKVVGKEHAGSLGDFNRFVYEGIHIDRDDYFDIRKDLVEWEKFLVKCKVHSIPVYIFSNAPKEWCLNFIDEDSVCGFVGDNLPEESDFLKPELPIFEVLSTWFSDRTIYFIDDKVHNMKHSVNDDGWVNIIYNESNSQPWFKLQDRLYVSKSLDACGDIICY